MTWRQQITTVVKCAEKDTQLAVSKTGVRWRERSEDKQSERLTSDVSDEQAA